MKNVGRKRGERGGERATGGGRGGRQPRRRQKINERKVVEQRDRRLGGDELDLGEESRAAGGGVDAQDDGEVEAALDQELKKRVLFLLEFRGERCRRCRRCFVLSFSLSLSTTHLGRKLRVRGRSGLDAGDEAVMVELWLEKQKIVREKSRGREGVLRGRRFVLVFCLTPLLTPPPG